MSELSTLFTVSIDTIITITPFLSVRNMILETLEQYNNYAAFLGWVFYITGLVYIAALVCYGFGKQAVGE